MAKPNLSLDNETSVQVPTRRNTSQLVLKRRVEATKEPDSSSSPTKKQRRRSPNDDKILDTFLSDVDDDGRREDIRMLHELIREHAPDLEPTLEFSKTLGYGKYHYRYKTGREGDWTKIGISIRKNGLTIHFCAVRNGKYILEAFDTKKLGVPKHVGKSCIRFNRVADLNLDLLGKIVEVTSKADIMT
mmetsp:Transcript_21378/g.49339  ORF Transcript_21378/g.49339 Transcript_21378/m.49339 type:complete len:188 (+) Transcript_21378:508-1071(+)|eukprot:CAMPEP_0116837620 /NCGR_PEP_ID=MMETSP0418-20121206/8751_1 /TAXON_ID=1158023 /ORGANISM="Astrosyne radiata, Strain 13vi08-1A" /LENGTH=187 /DNA_ID=CAMNT_0004467517 /DNA_START=2002 /DNA_END=2565 /DNA_ORIENTATION=+